MALRQEMEFEGAVRPDAISVDSYEHLLSAARTIGLPSNQQELVDLTDGTVIYIGTACSGYPTTSGTDNDESKPNWMIQQITIADPLITTLIGWGRWSNRLSLDYA
jgi:hypothetical protein